MSKYTSISLPKQFTIKIEEFISSHPEEGYTSITDFVKQATRSLLDSKIGG
jgi:Arc/MetJ-type ribon-helix-helix transcriptional regulator